MNSAELFQRLYAFQANRKIASKGALAVVLHISRFARENGLPLQVELAARLTSTSDIKSHRPQTASTSAV